MLRKVVEEYLQDGAPVGSKVLAAEVQWGPSTIRHELASLEELGRLVKSLGYQVAGTVSQKREGTGAGALLGSGKLAELAALTGGTGVVGSMAPPPMSRLDCCTPPPPRKVTAPNSMAPSMPMSRRPAPWPISSQRASAAVATSTS